MRLFFTHAALVKAFRSAALQGFDRLACAKNSIPKKANLFFHRSLKRFEKKFSQFFQATLFPFAGIGFGAVAQQYGQFFQFNFVVVKAFEQRLARATELRPGFLQDGHGFFVKNGFFLLERGFGQVLRAVLPQALFPFQEMGNGDAVKVIFEVAVAHLAVEQELPHAQHGPHHRVVGILVPGAVLALEYGEAFPEEHSKNFFEQRLAAQPHPVEQFVELVTLKPNVFLLCKNLEHTEFGIGRCPCLLPATFFGLPVGFRDKYRKGIYVTKLGDIILEKLVESSAAYLS